MNRKSTMQNAVIATANTSEFLDARLGRRRAADDRDERPGHGETGHPDREREADHAEADEDGPAERPAHVRLALPDERRGDEHGAREPEEDGERPGEHPGSHRAEPAQRKAAAREEREGGECEKAPARQEILGCPDAGAREVLDAGLLLRVAVPGSFRERRPRIP